MTESTIEGSKLPSKLPWYRDGLRFACTGCGKCCTGAPGYVWVTPDEITAIAAYLGIERELFCQEYVREVDGRLSLTESSETYDCAFLEGARCRIYPVRPSQCSTFPWWPQNLRTPQAWRDAAAGCEGISPDAPLVSAQEIDAQRREYLNKDPQCLSER